MPAPAVDRAVFEQVALPYLEDVHRFASSLTRHDAQAEDLTQETFLAAFRAFDRFEPGTNCKAWLFRIAKNLFIDRLREVKRRPRHQTVVGDLPTHDPQRSVRAFEAHGIENEEIFLDLFGDEVNTHLAELPEEFRRAVLLCDVEGLRYDEIAGILDVPIGTVRSRISRGRAHLRDRLSEYARELGYGRVAGNEERG
jgi:RNA polymerase sigma-70 factor (ECF subfamily)